ncbi:nitroreductase family protein [Robiginitalea sp. M366]|uniref:nitroreductase family protein n=1 Tax=Robiginitalea aestuariiviva TaxID=3036903 RepID=UPI00240D813D|nr:nitroreductase family protein [Robiginitalea aestuariiviva]MDG1571179.1 nitroreductase family protein [Robiginitalea aestuariiviva]
MEKTVTEAIHYRRSVRIYQEEPIDSEKVKASIENAVLAPTSSNLQLWEFYQVTDPDIKARIVHACMDQPAARTARQLVVVVARKDKWRDRVRANLGFLEKSFGKKPKSDYTQREKFVFSYYRKIMPSLYTDFLGILGCLKYIAFSIMGAFRPMYRQVRASDMRIVAHKSAALAAENFMLSMAAIGYDTCPMEGHDSLRIKKALGLPSGAEINMVIGCGIRKPEGVYGPRFRVPFEEVYRRV